MKTLMLILTLTLIPQLVFASNAEGLRAAIDEFQYAVTVEWDQKDPSFYQEQNEILLSKVSALIGSGLSKEDIVSSFPQLDINQLELGLGQVDLTDPKALRDYVHSNYSYMKGSSWSGEVALTATGIILGVTFVVLFAMAQEKRSNSSNPHQPMQWFPWWIEE